VKRGDLVTVALQGDHGKPRPALIIQTDLIPSHPSIVVLPVTTTIISAPLLRITLEPLPETGLRTLSQVMVDKPIAVRRERLGKVIGHIDEPTLGRITRSLAMWLGIA
jgi:mRNA interferase MazF